MKPGKKVIAKPDGVEAIFFSDNCAFDKPKGIVVIFPDIDADYDWPTQLSSVRARISFKAI